MRFRIPAAFVFLSTAPCLARDNPAAPQAISATLKSTPAPETRPRVGVALEGGGALGQAHVGVLKWFEEHHIPVDYVAGTSMGGLVGGLYATGESADEMTQVLKSADWPLLLRGPHAVPGFVVPPQRRCATGAQLDSDRAQTRRFTAAGAQQRSPGQSAD